ncbi:SDR family oxidoreductase [Pseudonocardiaceae bacterium YIM PH 21723]|nr:SDR family oxidoreductase [Pseudonocardiaceae bacterium YIM PH 21723]
MGRCPHAPAGRRSGRGSPGRRRPAGAGQVQGEERVKVLITGGASGLGKAIATRYAKSGAQVLITDVNAEAGKEVAAELGTDFLQHDVRSTAEWNLVLHWVTEHWGSLDILVNNAGVAAAGFIEETSEEDWDWIIDINLKGVVHGCRTFTPLLRAQKSGHIVNIASLAALMLLPSMSAYNATKIAVLGLSETLRTELEADNVKVTVVCPNFFPTNLPNSMRAPNEAYIKRTRSFMKHTTLTAESVAETIFESVRKGKFKVLTDRQAKISYAVKTWLPWVYRAQLRKHVKRAS